jgi:NhaP-type Na+/H+ or K+/H+ antiporter
VLLGGAAVHGLLDGFDALSVAVAVACVFVVRPISCRLALMGGRTLPLERRTIAFFGIRGIASFYYVAYAVTAADFPDVDRIWSAVATTVLLSVVVHGVAAAPVMQRVDRYRAAQRLVRHRGHQ